MRSVHDSGIVIPSIDDDSTEQDPSFVGRKEVIAMADAMPPSEARRDSASGLWA